VKAEIVKMSEAELQEAVIDLARLRKWRVAHFRSVPVRHSDGRVTYMTPVQADGAGFPDLVLARERVIFVELKSDVGRTSVDQQDWLFALSGADAECHLWRPVHWRNGTIADVLG
jgi:hypothetical protein